MLSPNFQPSLQTHFNARVDRATLEHVRGFGFRWARIDAQATSGDAPHDDRGRAGRRLSPLPIVYDLDRLARS